MQTDNNNLNNNNFDMFPNFTITFPSNELEGSNVIINNKMLSCREMNG